MSTSVLLKVNEEISLRQIEISDAAALIQLVDGSRASLRKFLNWVDQLNSLEDAQKFITNCNRRTEELRGITFFILHNEIPVGSIALYDWVHDIKCISVGYWISDRFRNQGIVTASMRRNLEYAFVDLEMEKVQLYYVPHNNASERIADKLGFKIEGYIRRSFMINGSLQDQYLCGLLREEYFSK